MGRDIKGIMRGKCNTCEECDEYLPPQEGQHGVRCDYCNHTPAEHVKMIKLGACTGCNDCEEYMSEKETSYTKCEYCGCIANKHKGAEKLRKPSAKHQGASESSSGSARGLSPSASASSGLTCKFPGCTRTRYFDTASGKHFEFCGKTCGQKFQKMQASGLPISTGGGPGGGGFPAAPPTLGGGAGGGQPSLHSNACKKCGVNPCNPGYSWCQKCFLASKGGLVSPSGSSCSAS